MKDTKDFSEGGVSVRVMDIIVALLLMIVGAVVMADSYRIGASWSEFGPESGYFPFYIGLLIFASSAITLGISIFKSAPKREIFVEPSKFKLVLQVLVPSAIFVVLIGYIGIYVSAALFIAFFMAWLGRYSPMKILPVAAGVPIVLFFLFEVWFLVPLPKGPLEALFGY